MCGITGAVWTDLDKAIDAAALARMTDALSHRGPDARGEYREIFPERAIDAAPAVGVALGHRRLKVIDLQTGAQPMSNEDRTVWVVFNGEIYNHVELRRRLEGSGHRFQTHCDTEVLVHLYEDEGLETASKLNGMFAAAIWDASRRRLVLLRDRLGQKPLVYRLEEGRLLFASELKSLLQLPGLSRTIDPNAIDEYLAYQYVPPPRTIWREFRKLPPGCVAVYEDRRLEVRRYWSPEPAEPPTPDQAPSDEELRELFFDSVRLRLQSDVPIGVFLSGGIDSSLVAAAAAWLHDGPVQTFSIAMPDAHYDESRQARRTAEFLGTEHHEFPWEADAVEMASRVAVHYDEPFADSSAVPTWQLAGAARPFITVALSGDGGDELFAGYNRYRAVALAQRIDRLPRPLRSLFTSRLWKLLPAGGRQSSPLRLARRFAESLSQSPLERYFDWISKFNQARRADLYHGRFIEQLGESDPIWFLGRAWSRVVGDDLTRASTADLMTYLPCDLMTKVDMATMAHGLECRQPMLDFRLVEAARRIPSRRKLRCGKGKRILKDVFSDLVLREIWHRPKRGFALPLAGWFRNQLRPMTHEMLLADDTRLGEFIRGEAVAQLVAEHEKKRFDHGERLWTLLMLELWLRRYS